VAIQITNTLTGKKEPFVPLEPGVVRMYVCGPTVYGLTHIGNTRPAVFFDVVRRHLEARGFRVLFVSNYTDVDDKIIRRAREEKVSSLEISEKYIDECRKDMDALNVRPPDKAPKVTEFVPQIVRFIERLVEKGAAYVAPSGEVFYAVRKFPDYGKLSGKRIDDLLVGVRIEADEQKRDPLDFSLWKPQKAEDEPAWDSPWGKGRPGWHIECSAMALELLGETFDIHGGGIDLQHPHHENELAQSEALTGKPFVNVWMHNNLLTIGDAKMSKSLGNFFLNRDFIAKFGGETLKFLLLNAHYRSPIDFSAESIAQSQSGLHRIYSALKRAGDYASVDAPDGPASAEENRLAEFAKGFEDAWRSALDDDFNTARPIASVFDYVRLVNAAADKRRAKPTKLFVESMRGFLANLASFGKVMNLFEAEPNAMLRDLRLRVLAQRGLDPASVDEALRLRTEARAKKDFAAADALRNEWLQRGIEFRDSPTGSEWDVLFTEKTASGA
jgi:cysteinyl-tRNA synthetase